MEGIVKTRTTSRILADSKLLEQLVKAERRRRMDEALHSFDGLKTRFYEETNKKWVKIQNKAVYFLPEFNFLMIDPTRAECGFGKLHPLFFGDRARLMSVQEARSLFKEGVENPWMDENNYIIVKDNMAVHHIGCSSGEKFGYIYCNSFGQQHYYSDSENSQAIAIPICNCDKAYCKLELFIRGDLIPDGFSDDEKYRFSRLRTLYQDKDLVFSADGSSKYFFTDAFVQKILSGNYNELNGISFMESDIIDYIRTNVMPFDENISLALYNQYLNCDYIRAEIDPYDSKILEDIERGHWDLWEEDSAEGISVELSGKMVARNPLADIQQDGIVGIDFGTKSTVVVFQNGNDKIWPMRVGGGRYKKETKREDYENPTVMEFRNLEHFMSCYHAKQGRPDTLWEDLTVSHKAAEQLKGESDSGRFYSFFSDLKQWCGDKNRRVRIRDNQGQEQELPTFLEIQEGAFNPIELYAYYLGLYINNMRQKIYLNYILSFPVTYEKRVKEKIVESFERGIKKSLPQTVLNDEKAMSDFRVRQWSSEPAAYAICALSEYGFDPEEGEQIFYGIFDFGGGTTDFDFGIWKRSDKRRYRNVIEHFGAGGDQYLGGEHLLEMMAYYIFRENKEKLLQAEISFYRPHDCENFVGSEDLLYDSQEARLNIRQLMEKLRGLWQNDNEEDIQAIEEGSIKVLLFTKSGKLEPNFELVVNKDDLLQLLRDRIEDGVKNFFAAMVQTFSKNDLKEARGIHIFLAGNSSKSVIVKELFDQYSQEWTRKIQERFPDEMSFEDPSSFFYVYPPLGTEEARKIQKERGIHWDEETDWLTRPTGKTGVAYGLIQGRPGSRIQVISEIKNTDEVKFKYYIGYEDDGEFRMLINRNIEYNKWTYFIDALETDFEFYYTSLPDVALSKSPITKASKKLCRIQEANEDEDRVGIYIRAVEPTVVEYVVADKEGLEKGEYIEQPRRVELP